MDGSFHYLAMANHCLLQKKLFASIKDTHLSLGQPKVLDYLGSHDGINQKELANGCHIEAPTLTSVLSRMEENHLIERRMLNGNRRSLHVYLTEEGRELNGLIAQAFVRLEKEAFQGISEEEQNQFMNVFLRIYENLNTKEQL